MLQAAKKAGLISESTSQNITSNALVIDKNKIRRETVKSGTKLKDEARLENPVCAIYFDGRKDETLTALGLVKEEHISS